MPMKFLKLLFALSLLFVHFTCYAAADAADDLFNLDTTPAITANNDPFTASAFFDRDSGKIHFEINCLKGAYVYKDSLKLETTKGSKIALDPLPQPAVHEDALGRSDVYFDKIDVYVTVNQSFADDHAVLSYRGCDSQGICYPPKEIRLSLPDFKSRNHNHETLHAQMQQEQSSLQATQNQDLNSTGLFLRILLFLIMGAGLDLTPCVLPLLGIFSAMILGQGKTKLSKSLILSATYLAGLTVTYTLLGWVFASLGMSAHVFLSSPYFTAGMALVLIVLACDSLGLITVHIPKLFNNVIQNKLAAQKRGTYMSALFFGLLSGLMTTPCTSAPLAGVLLYITQAGDVFAGTLMFSAIGLGMGLPLCAVGLCGQGLLKKFSSSGSLIKKLIALPLLWVAFTVAEVLWNYHPLPLMAFAFGMMFLFCHILLSALPEIPKFSKFFICIFYAFCALFVTWHSLPQTVQLPFKTLSSLTEFEEHKDRDLFLSFSASWCANCHVLDEKFYAQDEFAKLLDETKLTALRFELDDLKDPETKAVAEHFEISGVPTAIIIKNGKIVSKISGFAQNEIEGELKKQLVRY